MPREVIIAPVMTDDGKLGDPPQPAYCLIENGRPLAYFRKGEESGLVVAYLHTKNWKL